MQPTDKSAVQRNLDELVVAKNLLKIRFCVVCNEEMSDEVCCACEMPTIPRLART